MKVKLGFLLSAHCLIMLYNVQSFTKISDDLKNYRVDTTFILKITVQSFIKISDDLKNYRVDTIFILKITKKYNSVTI